MFSGNQSDLDGQDQTVKNSDTLFEDGVSVFGAGASNTIIEPPSRTGPGVIFDGTKFNPRRRR